MTAVSVPTDSATTPESALGCPRCGAPLDQPFYGPCPTCRSALRQQYDGLARHVEAAEYEPKMNVTPNAVATKDD